MASACIATVTCQ
jgi:hypothetical protein